MPPHKPYHRLATVLSHLASIFLQILLSTFPLSGKASIISLLFLSPTCSHFDSFSLIFPLSFQNIVPLSGQAIPCLSNNIITDLA